MGVCCFLFSNKPSASVQPMMRTAPDTEYSVGTCAPTHKQDSLEETASVR